MSEPPCPLPQPHVPRPARDVRRAQLRQARDAFPPMGVYAIRNHASGVVRVRSSRHVTGAINRLCFELRMGSHRDRTLQAEWDALGPERLTMDVLELVRERDDPAFDYDGELDVLAQLHRLQLQEAAPAVLSAGAAR